MLFTDKQTWWSYPTSLIFESNTADFILHASQRPTFSSAWFATKTKISLDVLNPLRLQTGTLKENWILKTVSHSWSFAERNETKHLVPRVKSCSSAPGAGKTPMVQQGKENQIVWNGLERCAKAVGVAQPPTLWELWRSYKLWIVCFHGPSTGPLGSNRVTQGADAFHGVARWGPRKS